MPYKTGIVYCARSKTSRKRYVGQTVRLLARRRQSHEYAARKMSPLPFHAALRKYGATDFTWRVLRRVVVSELDKVETEFIEKLATYKKVNGYNIARVGGHKTRLGLKIGPFSIEHRRKISEAHKGKKVDSAHLAKLHAGRRRWKPTLEFKLAVSRAHKGRKHTEEARRNMSRAQKGRVFSVEHRRKLSEVHKGKKGHPVSSEVRARISATLMGHKVSRKTRLRIKKALRKRKLNRGRA